MKCAKTPAKDSAVSASLVSMDPLKPETAETAAGRAKVFACWTCRSSAMAASVR